MARTSLDHPALQFQAPGNILHGVPLKEILGPELVRLIGESFRRIHPRFDRRKFVSRATEGLDQLELSQRARHIGTMIAEQLPQPFSELSRVLITSLGPELTKTEGNGLAPFFYLPHTCVISDFGVEDFRNGMRANYEITRRFSAEASIRPFLVRYRDECLAQLTDWTSDLSPHVRRLVSEGTRPRLPWATRLKEFQQNPRLSLGLLELLKDDPELYVRRSVANHLGDILKDHPDVAYEVCVRWLREVRARSTSSERSGARKWIIRHAVRLPARKGDSRAVELRVKAR